MILLLVVVRTVLFAQEYYPEGTKWTEIRLDTLKYDYWYSKVGDKWEPNFEKIEYCVQGEYINRDWVYKKVNTNGPEWTDSLTLLIREGEYNGHHSVLVSVPVLTYDGNTSPLWPGEVYQFDWSIGKGVYYTDIILSNTTSSVGSHFYYGIINELKEGDFGGIRLLKYVDFDGEAPENEPNSPINYISTDGGRIIQGIGITEWNDGECLFGPTRPYDASIKFGSHDGALYPVRHYRSKLVHFELNGEVLYDCWPESRGTNGVKSIKKVKESIANTCYDIQGRMLSFPTKGFNIIRQSNGNIRKVIVK